MRIITTSRIIQGSSKVYTACFIYIFMEWLFFITKPSILSYYTLPEKISIVFLLPLLIFISLLPVVLFLFAVDEWLIKKDRIRLVMIVPALIYAGVIFLLIENFSNTMFGFYSGSFLGPVRYVYLAAFCGLIVYLFLLSTRDQNTKTSKLQWTAVPIMVAACLVVGTLYAITGRGDISAGPLDAEFTSDSGLPNILILSSDGINRRNMSAYGYERETTPFIKTLMEDSLVSANHFANSSHTASSVISMLTGKLPVTTGVIYPPDGLAGVDAYEHLPGILQKRGYRNADISVRYYADTLDLNMLDAFHVANDRRDIGNPITGLYSPLFSPYPEQEIFLKQSLDRINSRLLHIAGIRDIEDVFGLVTSADNLANSVAIDGSRIEQLFDFINNNSEPFFVHLHLMGTHGPRFRPTNPIYSLGQEQIRNHMQDFYDDSIRDFDRNVTEIYDFLEDRGTLENTLVIINSDHSRNPNVGLPVPLIMDFPGNQHSGVIEENTQRLDLAPTILDYLDIDIPEWMEGRSLLSLEEDPRLIFAYSSATTEYVADLGWTVLDPIPPFNTLNKVFVLNCQRIYELIINEQSFKNRLIPRHSVPCSQDKLLPAYEIAKAILNQLNEQDYDISSLGWLTELAEFFSKSRASLRGDTLYLPAVEYQDGIYAAVLINDDSGNFVIDDLQVPLNIDEVSIFNQETASFILTQADVNGEIGNLRLTLISANPTVFKLTIEE
ncbi:MAG: sulfatase-like hydrolase/transferase [Gammaproteobacteria bacterium]|nr:sulfatase-like hydrolase/transferase [Gammaproteobacteria bacterium]